MTFNLKKLKLRLESVSSKRHLLLIGSLVAVCGIGLGIWRWNAQHEVVFADQLSARRPLIPSSLRKLPVEIVPAAQAAPSNHSTVQYKLGDRLKITMFERVDVTDEEQNNVPANELVERTELTGEYIVQESGYIMLPLLGAVEVEGQSSEKVVEALETAFKQAMRRPAKASVVLLDREPVYLVGKGFKPGSFKYTPGMTVLHAVALSGAGKDENSELYSHTEYARGLEKLEISNQRLRKLLAQGAALHAQQEGRAAEVPARLIELAGPQEAKKLVDGAVTVRKLIVAARQPQIAAYQAALAAARQEAGSHANRIALLEEHIKLHSERRDAVAEIRKHNDGLANALVQMENEVATVKEKKEEAVAALSKAQDNIAQAEQNLAKLEANTKLELVNDIVSTDSEIAEQEAVLMAARRLTSDLRIASLRGARMTQNLAYEILRRGREGTSRIKATETTELTPGDLVQVTSPEDVSGI